MALPRPTLLLRAACALAAALALMLLGGAVQAHAVPASAAGQAIQVMPQILLGSQDWNGGNSVPRGSNPNPTPLGYQGGPVLHSHNTFAIYWDSTSTSYPSAYPQSTKITVDGFLQDVGIDTGLRTNLFSINGQYTDSTGRAAYASTFRGAYTDLANYPSPGCSDPNASGNLCLTVAQVQTELQSMITRQRLPVGLNSVYLFMTPPAVVVCTDASGTNCSGGGTTVASGTQPGFCAYHAFLGSGAAPYADTSPYAVVPSPGSQPKNCQADGQGVSSSQPWIQLPNEAKTDQPLQPNANTTYPDYADVLIDNAAHEINGMMTDPLLNAWKDPSGQEAPDKCLAQAWQGQQSANGFDPWAWPPVSGTAKPSMLGNGQGYQIIWGTLNNSPLNQSGSSLDFYWLHGEWNNAENNCELNDELSPRFVAANPVNSGDLVGFDGTSTVSTLGAATYAWNFGDGTTSGVASASVPSVYHAYGAPGIYAVTLTVTDSGGYSNTTTHNVVVNGNPIVPGAPGGAPGASGAAGAAGAPGGPGTGGTPASLAAPTVSESILSHSLSRVLKGGLSVRYAVDQIVAGHFQVLLDRHTASRLHIGGSPAPGFGASAKNGAIVIGYSLLVASKAGHSNMSIRLTRSAAAHLRHTHSLQIAVRVLVANNGAHTATVTQLVSLGR